MTTPTSKPTPAQLVEKYMELRRRKTEINRQAKEAVAAIDADLDVLSSELMNICNVTGLESFRTDFGTVYRTLKTKFFTSDMAEFMDYVESTGRIDLLERRVSQTALLAMFEAGEELPPGITPDQEYQLTVRKA